MAKEETIKKYFENIFNNIPVSVKKTIILEEGCFQVEVEYAKQSSHHIDLDYERALQKLAKNSFYENGWAKQITLQDNPDDPINGEMFEFDSDKTEYNARIAKYSFKVAVFVFQTGH